MNFVLDTSIFISPLSRVNPPYQNICEFFARLNKFFESGRGSFFVVSETIREMKNQISKKSWDSCPEFGEFFKNLRVQNPNIYEHFIPAALISELLVDFRDRFRATRKLGEELLHESAIFPNNDYQVGIFREKSRKIIRSNILDSPADFESILLAKETKNILVTEDNGMRIFAEKLGVEVVNLESFYENF